MSKKEVYAAIAAELRSYNERLDTSRNMRAARDLRTSVTKPELRQVPDGRYSFVVGRDR